MGSVYKWRIPQKDMSTCIKILKETKTAFKKSEVGVVLTCGNAKIERFYGSKWYQDSAEKN